ncbi:CAP domain-containing protein [Lactiplantibacillus paraxiangfangensis]|uniref:CAP domain-containing protein n=1 Tax=Lactiplantibacillus paraxiangfangensis TaxID=3076224 RepID=UPI0030C688E6
MKFETKLGVVALTVVVPVASVFYPTTAQASGKISRSKEVLVSAKSYYSTSNKGRTYKFKGSAKHLVLKHNHKLSNYKTTTWTRTKKTTITKHGKKYLYYYVRNNKNGAKGWVWHKYLKAGKNYQSSKVTSFSGTYQAKKLGKFYKVAGSTKYVRFSQGTKLAGNVKYTVSQKRTIYKKGKAYRYYYVTNPGTKQQGWTWNGYLTKVNKSSSNSQTGSSTIQGSSSATSGSSSSSLPEGKLDPAQVASQAVTTLNNERVKLGFVPLKVDGALTKVANVRAVQLGTEYDHYFNGVDAGNVLAKQYGADSYYMTEDLTMTSGYNENPAVDLIYGFKSDSHWNDLINVSASTIGIGLAEDPTNPGAYYVAVEMGF